jgi:zinc transport system substrate-binding protein
MRALTLLLVLLASGTGCETGPEVSARDDTLRVVASLYPIASLIREVGGDAVSVRTLLPPGAHADSYEATPRMAEALSGADLVVRVGGAVDDWLGNRGRADHLVLTEGLTLRGRDHDHEPGRAPGAGNPHVWLDPILVRDTVLPLLVERLSMLAPEAGPDFHRRAREFADSLTALDVEIRALLDAVPVRRFVAAHPAWTYFAERYDLEEVGSLHPSPGTELGARELARLVATARARGGAAVIAEPQLGRAGVDALARELGVPVEIADPVGGPQLDGRDDYLSLMRYNARAFARALGAVGP